MMLVYRDVYFLTTFVVLKYSRFSVDGDWSVHACEKYAADMTFGQVQWGVDVGWLSYGLIKISLRLLGI